jgi:tRNA(fMet)-specific endonuclease VapC
VRYLLDTDTCVDILRRSSRKRYPSVANRYYDLIATCEPGDLGISAITMSELAVGAYRAKDMISARDSLLRFLLPIEVLPYHETAAWRYGKVQANLLGVGNPIRPLDAAIGAHALALELPLVTSNQKHYSRIEGLSTVSWRDN